MEIIKIIILALSGLLLFLVGTKRLFNPVKTYLKNSGITLENDVNLLNEIRGVSSLMLVGGIIILLGTVLPNITLASHLVAVLIFIGFAVGRLLSLKLDGKPNKLIIQGLVSELILGGANAYFLITI
jgi:hypothetical protein